MPSPTPPTAERRPHVREHHGDRVEDPYAWMRDLEDPALLAHLEAENAYAEARTEHLAPLRTAIVEEIRSRVKETDLSVPVASGPWWYYARTVEGRQYAAQVRAPLTDPAVRPDPEADAVPGEQVVVDGNVEAGDSEFFSLGALTVSADHRLVAFAVDTAGDERFDLTIRDIATGEVLDTSITGIGYGVELSRDGRFVFYTRLDDAWRPYQLWRHRVGGDPADDVLVHQEDDERFWMGVAASRDERWLLLGLGSKTTSEVHVLDADDPAGCRGGCWPRAARGSSTTSSRPPTASSSCTTPTRPTPTSPGRRSTRRATSSGCRGWARARASGSSPSTRSTTPPCSACAPVGSPRCGCCPATRPHPPATASRGTSPSTRRCTRSAWATTPSRPSAPSRSSSSRGPPRAPCSTSTSRPASARCSSASRCSATSTSRTTPSTGSGPRHPTARSCRSRWCTASALEADGTNPGVVTAYGSYEISSDPYFSVARLSLLDRGVVYAVAHVRGGGEMGRRWYDDGKLLAKTNTFTDTARRRRPPRGLGMGVDRPRRARRWFCRRAARRGGAQPGPGEVPRGARRRAVRRRPHDDAAARPAAHRGGVGGVGQPARRPRGVCRDARLRAVRERARGRLPGGAGDLEPARHPRLRHRAGQVGHPVARDRHQRPAGPPGAAAHRARGRARRAQRAVSAWEQIAWEWAFVLDQLGATDRL